jgi:hypothetical protein
MSLHKSKSMVFKQLFTFLKCAVPLLRTMFQAQSLITISCFVQDGHFCVFLFFYLVLLRFTLVFLLIFVLIYNLMIYNIL